MLVGVGYDGGMASGRPSKRTRPAFGERMARARLEAGLTQHQLAERLHTTQSVIAYWERNPVALRSDQLIVLAKTLTVSTDDLLGHAPPKVRGNGPPGKLKQLFAAVARLPRRQQQKIVDVVEALLARQTTDRTTAA